MTENRWFTILNKWDRLGWNLHYYNVSAMQLQKRVGTKEYYITFDREGVRASTHFGKALKLTQKELMLVYRTSKLFREGI